MISIKEYSLLHKLRMSGTLESFYCKHVLFVPFADFHFIGGFMARICSINLKGENCDLDRQEKTEIPPFNMIFFNLAEKGLKDIRQHCSIN